MIIPIIHTDKMENTLPCICNQKNAIICLAILSLMYYSFMYVFKTETLLGIEILLTLNALSKVPIDVQPCYWMSLPLKVRYPRFRTDITFPRMFQCFKDLNAKQDNKKILWLPAADTGSLLQPVALGGSHGFRTDSDLDIWL